eukprot:716038-Lingulodinium_polyedra.AAC.1
MEPCSGQNLQVRGLMRPLPGHVPCVIGATARKMKQRRCLLRLPTGCHPLPLDKPLCCSSG